MSISLEGFSNPHGVDIKKKKSGKWRMVGIQESKTSIVYSDLNPSVSNLWINSGMGT